MIRPSEDDRKRVPTPLFPAAITAVYGTNDDERIPRRFHLQPPLHGTLTPPELNPESRRARNDQWAIEECRVFHRRVLQGLQWFVLRFRGMDVWCIYGIFRGLYALQGGEP